MVTLRVMVICPVSKPGMGTRLGVVWHSISLADCGFGIESRAFGRSNYWLVVDGPAGEILNWDQNSTGTSGFLETNGTAGNYPTGSNPNASETNGVFEVDGTFVSGGSTPSAPEPAAWLLMVAGIGTMALVRQARP
jgi:hypothetical protein